MKMMLYKTLLFLRCILVRLHWLVCNTIKTYVCSFKNRVLNDLHVLYMTSDFIVVNKQFDIAINSDTPDMHPVTVATQLAHKFPFLYDQDVVHGFRFIHRLDYSTSGVLCIALTKNAAKQGCTAFFSKKVKKYYLALVKGHITSEMIIMNRSIGTDGRPGFSHRMCTEDKEFCVHPKWALSKLLVLQRGLYNNFPATKVLMTMLTGRRHQLRVHLHQLGHTIVGDYTYSDRTDSEPFRMFLHSFRLVMPTDIAHIDVCAGDPFTEEVAVNKWKPVETVNKLNQEVFLKFAEV